MQPLLPGHPQIMVLLNPVIYLLLFPQSTNCSSSVIFSAYSQVSPDLYLNMLFLSCILYHKFRCLSVQTSPFFKAILKFNFSNMLEHDTRKKVIWRVKLSLAGSPSELCEREQVTPGFHLLNGISIYLFRFMKGIKHLFYSTVTKQVIQMFKHLVPICPSCGRSHTLHLSYTTFCFVF